MARAGLQGGGTGPRGENATLELKALSGSIPAPWADKDPANPESLRSLALGVEGGREEAPVRAARARTA